MTINEKSTVTSLLLMLALSGCGSLPAEPPEKVEFEAFVKKAAQESESNVENVHFSVPSYIYDDPPESDTEKAKREFQGAPSAGVDVVVNGEVWTLGYKRHSDSWMLELISLRADQPRREVLFYSFDGHPISKVTSHKVFKHYIPPKHDQAKTVYDAIVMRMKQGAL